MILYFKVTNFKSIKETEISFISSNSLNTHLDHIYHLNKFNINKFILVIDFFYKNAII